ncbi:uncharacterized protein BDV17DRAFT_291305 [Aspergillus undulatus]|uniref:uncharacterized protein n=1 Tax=Aspergillus undulatus TaxID=1810928 RepID=UPI003CCCF5E6
MIGSVRVSKYRSNFSQRPTGTRQKRPPPRQDSPNAKDPRNVTSYHPDQADWSWTNLPDILYQLNPPENEERRSDPAYMSEPIHGKRLRNLPILPDNISSTVEEFRVEAWQRMDPRISLDDITSRMHPDFRIKNNALQQRGVRFRQAFNIKAWRSGNRRSAELEDVIRRRMHKAGLDFHSNSTRGITPGLIDPKAGEAGGRIPLPNSWSRKVTAYAIKLKDTKMLPAPADTESSVDGSEILPTASEAPASEHSEKSEDANYELEPEVVEHTHEFVKYDEEQSQPEGALPTIRGTIPDEELPDSVGMYELDLRQGYRYPMPQLKVESEDLPLMFNQDRLDWRGRSWSPSSAISLHAFCHLPCFQNFPPYPEESLDYIAPHFAERSKLQTPTKDIFPSVEPVQLDMIPEELQKNTFDYALAEIAKNELHLCEMPYDRNLTA